MSAIDKKSYGKIIRDLITFFKGKKDDLLRQYRREMKNAAKERRFEEAATLRNRISFLTHIQDVAILKRENNEADKIEMGEMAVNPFGRIEGYDVSNISGTSTVASMVVFENGAPAKSEYRKFASRASLDQMTSRRFEVLMRRLKHPWRHPDLILVDGGLPQVHTAEQVIREAGAMHEFPSPIPVIGIAKGPERKRNDLICSKNNLELCHLFEPYKNLLINIRDEAHRFAIAYHRKVRSRTMRD